MICLVIIFIEEKKINNGGLDFTRGKFNVLVKSGSLYPSDFNSNESSLHQNIKTYISNLLFIYFKIELK